VLVRAFDVSGVAETALVKGVLSASALTKCEADLGRWARAVMTQDTPGCGRAHLVPLDAVLRHVECK
jgi:hypothetical protein